MAQPRFSLALRLYAIIGLSFCGLAGLAATRFGMIIGTGMTTTTMPSRAGRV